MPLFSVHMVNIHILHTPFSAAAKYSHSMGRVAFLATLNDL